MCFSQQAANNKVSYDATQNGKDKSQKWRFVKLLGPLLVNDNQDWLLDSQKTVQYGKCSS